MYFSKSLYFQALKKLKSVGIGMAATVFILNALYTFLNVEASPIKKELITGGNIAPFTFIVVIFSFFITTSAFSFLNNRKGSDFYHSIPLKRTCVYFSFIAAIATWIAGVVLCTLTFSFLLYFISPNYTISIFDTLLVFLGYTLSALVFASVVTFCRMISGTGTACIFYTACLLAIPRICFEIFSQYLETINPTIYIHNTVFEFISIDKSPYFVFTEMAENHIGEFGNVFLLINLFLEASAFFALGAYFYNKRKSEIAGRAYTSKKTQIIFRTLVSLPLLIIAIYNVIEESFLDISSIIVLSISVLIYFMFELILTKSALKALKSLPLILISLAASLTFVGSIYLTSHIFKLTNPTADEISSFSIIESDSLHHENLFECYNIPVNSEKAKEIVSSQLENSSFFGKALIKFQMKDGSEKYRNVFFEKNFDETVPGTIGALIAEIRKSEEYKRHNVTIPDYAYLVNVQFSFSPSLTDKTYSDYYNDTDELIIDIFRKEYQALSESQKKEIEAFSDSAKKEFAKMYLQWDGTVYYYYLSPHLTPNSLKYALNNFAHNHVSSTTEFIKQIHNAFSINASYEVRKITDHSFSFTFNTDTLIRTEESTPELTDEKVNSFMKFNKSLSEESLTNYSDLKNVYVVSFTNTKGYSEFAFLSFTEEQITYLLSRRVTFT